MGHKKFFNFFLGGTSFPLAFDYADVQHFSRLRLPTSSEIYFFKIFDTEPAIPSPAYYILDKFPRLIEFL